MTTEIKLKFTLRSWNAAKQFKFCQKSVQRTRASDRKGCQWSFNMSAARQSHRIHQHMQLGVCQQMASTVCHICWLSALQSNVLWARRQLTVVNRPSPWLVTKVTPASTLENIFVQLLIFVLVFIQFGSIHISSYSVLVCKIILVLVPVLMREKAIICILVLVHKNNTGLTSPSVTMRPTTK